MVVDITATTVRLRWSKPSLCSNQSNLDAFNFTLSLTQNGSRVNASIEANSNLTSYDHEFSNLTPRNEFKVSIYATNRIGMGKSFTYSNSTLRESRK